MTERQEYSVLGLPVGPIKHLLLESDGQQLLGITMCFAADDVSMYSTVFPDALVSVAQQLRDYSQHAHNIWAVSLSEQGTPYQRKVWRYLQTIPMGSTQTYGEVATALNSSARAVGNACRANPFLLIVPCHRVVKRTNIGGFGGKINGEAIAIKQWLLAHERQ